MAGANAVATKWSSHGRNRLGLSWKQLQWTGVLVIQSFIYNTPGRIACLFEVDAALLEGNRQLLHILKKRKTKEQFRAAASIESATLRGEKS